MKAKARANKAIRGAQRVAGVPQSGVHILGHTFFAYLAMKGAPTRALQELAGHADLSKNLVERAMGIELSIRNFATG